MILSDKKTNSLKKLNSHQEDIREHNIFAECLNKTPLKGKITAPVLARYDQKLLSIFSNFNTKENFSDVLKCLPNSKQFNIQEKILIEKYILHTTIKQYCQDSKTKDFDSNSSRGDLKCFSLKIISDYVNECQKTSEPDSLLISKISIRQTLISCLLQLEESSNGQEKIDPVFMALKSKLANFIDPFIDPLGMNFPDESISFSCKTKHVSDELDQKKEVETIISVAAEFDQKKEVETIIFVAAENLVKKHSFLVQSFLVFINFFFNSQSDTATNLIKTESIKLKIVELGQDGDHSDWGYTVVGDRNNNFEGIDNIIQN